MNEDFDWKEYRRTWWNGKCPPLFQETDVEQLPEKAKRCVDSVLSADLNAGRGLLLHGITRGGKTRMAWLAIKKVSETWPDHEFIHKSIKVLDALDFGAQAADAYRHGNERTWIAGLCSADLLFVDDLGKSKITERGGEALFHVVDRRAQKKKSVIITTNLIGKSLEQRFEDRETAVALVARLREFCMEVTV